MDQDDATFGAPGGEPTPTPEAAPPIAADFMSSIMARLARQDEVQKTTNDQLAALVAALTAPDGQTNRPQQIRRRLFNTNPTATGGDHISDDLEPNETLLADHPPAGFSDLDLICRFFRSGRLLGRLTVPHLRGSFPWARLDSGPLHPGGFYLGWGQGPTSSTAFDDRMGSSPPSGVESGSMTIGPQGSYQTSYHIPY
ncbi:hypothetical protein F2Q70_00026726 [Brassica cretica]|uniref:Uncharacterized protein n=1 Tax=Brassica cretica TaxID=69181 RepID=A0A8S9LGR9_BRACR|nr:hypothetical protein F2Q70_00026726 [Brassica cretica]